MSQLKEFSQVFQFRYAVMPVSTRPYDFVHGVPTVLNESDHDQPSHIKFELPDSEKGGIIIFSTDVNATLKDMFPNASDFKRKLYGIWHSVKNKMNVTKMVTNAMPHNSGFTLGHNFKGRYIDPSGKKFDESSWTLEILFMSFEGVAAIAAHICRIFSQQEVLVKDNATSKIVKVGPIPDADVDLKEAAMGKGYWSIGTKVYDMTADRHMLFIEEHPDLFNLTPEDIKAIYEKYGERVEQEGKGREELIKLAASQGWVRVRHYIKPEDYWSIQVDNLKRRKNNIQDFLYWAMEHKIMDPQAPAVLLGYDNPADREVYDWQSGGIKNYLIQEKYQRPFNEAHDRVWAIGYLQMLMKHSSENPLNRREREGEVAERLLRWAVRQDYETLATEAGTNINNLRAILSVLSKRLGINFNVIEKEAAEEKKMLDDVAEEDFKAAQVVAKKKGLPVPKERYRGPTPSAGPGEDWKTPEGDYPEAPSSAYTDDPDDRPESTIEVLVDPKTGKQWLCSVSYYHDGGIIGIDPIHPVGEGYGLAEALITSTKCPECGSRMWEIPSASKGTIRSCTNPNCPEYHPPSEMSKSVRSAKTAFYRRDPLGKRY